MAIVGSHQQAPFTTPVNGTSPVDADEVRVNDNAVGTVHNAHDADATIHVQSSTLASRPLAGTAGRVWYTTDENRLYIDTGTTWSPLTLDAGNLTGGTVPTARVAGAYNGITSVGTLDDLVVSGLAEAGSVNVGGTATAAQFVGPLTGAVTGNVTGNADTATKLSSTRTVALTGDVTGSVATDLTSGASVATTYTGTVPITKGGTGLTATPTNGQLPVGNGSGYTLAALEAGNNITVTNTAGNIRLDVTGTASGVSGSGTSGTVPRWTGGGTTSQLTTGVMQDDGTNVGVGGAPDATAKAKVYGSMQVTGSLSSVNGVPYTWPSSQGAANTVLVNNGSGTLSWASSSEPLDQQTFNSSGTWTKPSLGSMALIEVWGAGGSGSTDSGGVFGCNGGAGGSYMERMVRLADLGATETVTVGAGGLSRGAGTNLNGLQGGNSSFGSWVTAYGGGGGQTAAGTAFGGTVLRAIGSVASATSLLAAWSITYADVFDRTFNGGCTDSRLGDVEQMKNSVYGGGAGASTTSGGTLVAAGTSRFGGNGGATANAGTAPGGGGGRANTAGASGAGAAGRVRITVW